MSEEAAFLEVLKANPADDVARLVYADWLDEHDEPAKAEYLRAVADLARLPGGSVEYADAAARLYTACRQTDNLWRRAAGGRFDVMIDRCAVACKIPAIKAIRELTGFGLAEAKAMAESVPTPLFSWRPFEWALLELLRFHSAGLANVPEHFDAAIRPTVWPAGMPGAVFDVFICEHNYDFAPRSTNNHGAHYAVQGISRILGITEDEARNRLQKLPILVGSGLHPTAVADFVRQLKLFCNIYHGLTPNSIRVVPRLPTE